MKKLVSIVFVIAAVVAAISGRLARKKSVNNRTDYLLENYW